MFERVPQRGFLPQLSKASSVALLAASYVGSVGCGSPPFGRVSDAWTVSAGSKGGSFSDRVKPTDGAPLAYNSRAKACLRDAEALSALGPTCDHESENAPLVTHIGDLPGGLPEPSKEVRWYCSERLVVRVVLERCDASGAGNLDGIKPVEISVAPHPKAP